MFVDLYCKAGGAGKGYALAGFDVRGMDWEPQPRYPFPFTQGDVLAIDPADLMGVAAIHASPPCQFATALNNDKSRHANCIPATRDLLLATGRPFIIENVMGAAEYLCEPIMLCGCMFGLGTETHRLERRRLFECHGFPRPRQMPCICHRDSRPVIGVYGGHARDRGGVARDQTRSFMGQSQRDLARRALGMNWGTLAELSEAIPPVYTAWLGWHLRAALG